MNYMKTEIVGKNISVTEGIRASAEKCTARLDKYLEGNETAHVLVRTYPYGQKAEITVRTKYGTLHAEETDEDLYEAIDKVGDKLVRQLKKHREKLIQKGRRMARAPEMNEDEAEETVVRKKKISAKMMTADEAVMQMELSGHDFFAFLDEEGVPCVVYRRKHGGYGLLAAEA